MRNKYLHVVAIVPSMGFWRAETAVSTAIMFGYFGAKKVVGAETQKLSIMSPQGSVIAALRHSATKAVMQNPTATHLLFVDSDMDFPRTALHRLLAWDKDIVAANCTTRKHPVEQTAHDFNHDKIDSRDKDGIVAVRQVGLAIALIRTEVIKKLRPPLYLNDWIPAISDYCGEDVYFCQVAQAAGFEVFIDHELSVEIGHVGSYIYGHKDIPVTTNEPSDAA